MVGTPFDFLLSGQPEFEPFDPAGKSITIEELRVSRPRIITLSGRAMPKDSINFGGTQRGEVTMYPGNPVGTVQVLGPVEDDSELKGEWKDRFLRGAVTVDGDTKKYELAQELVQLFHEIRRSGVALRVQWLDEVRFGWLAEFSADPKRATDIEWSMTFSWYASGDDKVPRLLSSEAEPPKKLLGALSDLLTVIASAPGILRDLQALGVTLVNEIASTVQVLVSVLEAIDEATDLPGTLIGAALSNLRAIDRQVADMISRIGDVAWPSISDAPNMAGPITDPVTGQKASQYTNALKGESWKREVTSAAGVVRDVAERSTTARVDKMLPRATRVVEVSSQASLYDLAIRYYGSADFAGFLAAANSIRSALVPAGARIKIPPKPTAPGGYSVGSGGKGC